MENWYGDLIDRIRFVAERDSGRDIFAMSREETLEMLKENKEDSLFMQKKKREDARRLRCIEMCNALKTMIDGFYATAQSQRAEKFVLDLCDQCFFTCAVEWDMPLCFYLELMEVDGIKIAIDSLINSIVGEIEDEAIIQIPLEEAFSDRLTAHIIYQAEEQRRKGQVEIVSRYKDVEYTMALKC